MRTHTMILLLLFATTAYSQTIQKSVIGGAGSAMVASGHRLHFTIGEPLVGAVSNEMLIGQGFWAGSLQVEPITETQSLSGITIYPNPVGDELNLYAGTAEILGISLFSTNGQMVMSKILDANLLEHTIDFSYLSRGMYVLRVTVKDSSDDKLFKLIKK